MEVTTSPARPPLRATLLGASGMVGTEVLHQCFEEPRIGEIVALVRKPLGISHPKLREIPHQDYTDYSALRDVLADTDLWFHCIGVYQGMVPEAEFYRVTCDYLASLLRDLEAVRTETTFCLFSADGADPSESSRILFRKAKGRAERFLTESRIARMFIFRPGYIDPGRKSAKSRIPFWLARPFYKLFPAIGIDAVDLARVMVRVGIEGSQQIVFTNAQMRSLKRTFGVRS